MPKNNNLYSTIPTNINHILSGDGKLITLTRPDGSQSQLPYQDNIIIQPVSGQFLLDPNEFNGWGALGFNDETVSTDLGNVGAGVSRVAGGFCFPYDVKLNKFFAHHYNNNSGAQAWGWRIITQSKQSNGSNTATNTDLLAEVADNGGTGPRDYASTANQTTDISFDASIAPVIPAGDVITLGVESPTAVTTNRYVRIVSGYLQFERV